MSVDPLSLRFRCDDPGIYGLGVSDTVGAEAAFAQGLSQNVRVTERVLPSLFKVARTVEARLGITQELSVFVYASPHINAYVCTDDIRERIVVFMSSSVLSHLDEDEWAVILGHELGHHLFGHHRYPRPRQPEPNLRVFELMRAAEISADRVGLLACGCLETTLRAMLKVASGLDSSVMDIDVTDYMRQLADLRDGDGAEWVFYSTHPPFPVRVRSVVRFDSVLREVRAGGDCPTLIASIDNDVVRDLEACTSGRNGRRFEEEAIAAAFWHGAMRACRDGKLSADEQAVLSSEFGVERVQSLKGLVGSASTTEEAMLMLEERALRARTQVDEAPLVAAVKFNEVVDRLVARGL